ncbi:D-alanyl-D-alanine carboxypeptidase [Paenibacillus spongiae]|uniref:D-alanyl-D-alanine carboxypeptidase n=2 Tax=Paenibacillus spongiae TaxID=2909671 RepID=A0ABY5SIZ4_9BACL|nr:D-alanyl-D-alanine carboxypeptidase family protein [Paenibacillus spongiae]UVI33614.1 D-alanyl-D-alanine carboxypeptidase [Paenibacillus spongiae]
MGWIAWAIPLGAEAVVDKGTPRIGTDAKAAALIDVESGRLLYSKAGDTPMRIASLTKIMTAIVAIEHGKLSDKVKTSKRAFAKEGSSIYLKLGEEMSLQNMLYGLMLRSGNDAATAIAEHVGGSEEGFVHLMNEKARMLGLTNSQFMNPHGLDQEGHYSSANDLAKLTAYALHNPTFKAIVKTPVKTAPNPNDEWEYKWNNKNKMLHMYEGADGVKTGYTKMALRCLVSSATRNGQQLAAVTINDRNDWVDHSKMLDWGFANYPLVEIAHKGQPINGYPLAVGRTVRYPFAAGEKEELRSKLILIPQNSAYYTLGERGTIEWYVGDNKIGSTMVYEPAGVRMSVPERDTATWSDASAADSFQPWAHTFGGALKRVLSALFGGMEGA